MGYEIGRILICLLKSAVSGKNCEILNITPILLEEVYDLAKFHSVEATAYYGVIINHIALHEKLKNAWSKRQALNTAKTMVELHERDAIYKLFEANGISFLPLKGLLLKSMYPSPEHRQMADLDIIVPRKQLEQAGKLLIRSGYQCHHVGKGNHDSYSKPPYVRDHQWRRLSRGNPASCWSC